MTVITEAVLYVILPFLVLLLLFLVIPVVVDRWMTKAKVSD